MLKPSIHAALALALPLLAVAAEPAGKTPTKPPEAAAPKKPAPSATPTPGPMLSPTVRPVTPATPTAAAQPATPAPTGPVGKVEIKETSFDAGAVDRGTVVTHSFQLKNVGKGDLTVDAKPG